MNTESLNKSSKLVSGLSHLPGYNGSLKSLGGKTFNTVVIYVWRICLKKFVLIEHCLCCCGNAGVFLPHVFLMTVIKWVSHRPESYQFICNNNESIAVFQQEKAMRL